MTPPRYYIPEEETLAPPGLEALQRRKLTAMLGQVLATNRFYQDKFAGLSFNPQSDPLDKLPFTTRKDLEQTQLASPPYGANLTFPLDQYCRFHQTSGSSGRPMRWLDTADSWNWFKKNWFVLFAAARVERHERFMFPFSFGPFIGFWAAFESVTTMGNLAIPAGGMTTSARLRLLMDNDVNVVCCTPTYALRMAEVAKEDGIDLAGSKVRALIVAGEPGGSIPETRARIESAWGARVYDHTGMTEIGPLGFECHENPGGVHLNEAECIPEVVDPQTGKPLPDGELGELIITNLGRWGSPVIRYRTNDQVRLTRTRCACGRHFARMEGGILARLDDMFIVRGNNVFPTAIESILRRFPEVAEFRVEAYDDASLTQVRIDLEPAPGASNGADLAQRVGHALQNALSFRAEIRTVSPGTLPRFEMKAKRFVKRSTQPDPSTKSQS